MFSKPGHLLPFRNIMNHNVSSAATRPGHCRICGTKNPHNVRANTPGNVKFVEKIKELEKTRLEEELKQAKTLSERLVSISCTLRVKVGEEDKLFGAVTAQDIAATLHEEGISIDRKKIVLEQPIKSLGIFQIPVRLHPEVTATLKVWVVKE